MSDCHADASASTAPSSCLQDQLSKCEQWVPAHLEIAHLPHQVGQPYGGVFLFTQSARMARPVRYWAGGGGLELLGTLEQSTLDIHCPDGGPGGTPGLRYTHGELSAGVYMVGGSCGCAVVLVLWALPMAHIMDSTLGSSCCCKFRQQLRCSCRCLLKRVCSATEVCKIDKSIRRPPVTFCCRLHAVW
jgi:hypothetical protein